MCYKIKQVSGSILNQFRDYARAQPPFLECACVVSELIKNQFKIYPRIRNVIWFPILGVHIMLADLLPQNTYFRFNPYLTEKCSIEETDPKKLEQMESDTIMYLRRNDDKFKEAAQKLKEPKYIYNRLSDWVSTKGILLGASMFSC